MTEISQNRLNLFRFNQGFETEPVRYLEWSWLL